MQRRIQYHSGRYADMTRHCNDYVAVCVAICIRYKRDPRMVTYEKPMSTGFATQHKLKMHLCERATQLTIWR